MYTYLASTYGSSTYDSSTYNGAATSTGTGSAGSTSAGGSLSNTGFDIALITTVACVIALAAVAVRIWKRPRKLAAEVVTNDDRN